MFWMSMHKHQTHDIFGDKLNQPWVFEIQIQAFMAGVFLRK